MVRQNNKIASILILVLLALALLTNPSLAQERKCKGECGGKHHEKKPTEEELKKILEDHAKWLQEVYEPAWEKDPEIQPSEVPQEGRANLCGADLWDANLSGADLWDANLSGADLERANLSEARLWNANLSGAKLGGANLSGAKLMGANLSGANLGGANLSGADLGYADLSGANLGSADMASVIFELQLEAPLPKISPIAFAKNLSQMRYRDSPHSLVELREAFKKAGLRQQEREITYAIEHTRRQKQMRHIVIEDVGEVVKGVFKLILFEWTCNYGMSPGRPLLILLGFIVAFGFPYWFALGRQGKAGIWQDWQNDRILKENGQDDPFRLYFKGWNRRRIWYSFYFSLLSTFHVGWREFNVGQWIGRIQRKEFTLRPTRWVRTVAGVQSLIGVYLLALSILTYFGHPFE